MAQFKSLNVLGNLSVTGKINSADSIRTYKLEIPTASGATTLGIGTNGQVLKSNGTSIYWGTDNDTVTNVSFTRHITTGVKLGTITINGTATDLYSGSLPLSGGTLSNNATITLNTFGTRTLTLSGNNIIADMSADTGTWAGSFATVKHSKGTTDMLGWYGNINDGLYHIYMGGTYDNPAMKMDASGNFTFSKVINGTIVNANTATRASQDGSGNTITSTYLPKTTYEWNKEVAFGQTGLLYIGAFPMYDSNVTVDIDSTTSTTYHATLVIATQNINTTGGGSLTATVYGDATNTIAPNIYIAYVSGSNNIRVYFQPQSWSKNLIHIRCVALAASPTNICSTISSLPSDATRKPTNALLSNYLPLTGGDLSGGLSINGSLSVRASVSATAMQAASYCSSAGSSGAMITQGSSSSILTYVRSSANAGNDNYEIATKADLSDTKVTQAYSTTNAYYPLLMTATSGASSTSSRGATTTILCNKIYANPSTGSLEVGSLSTSGNITCNSISSEGSISTVGNISADEGNLHAGGYLSIYDDGDAYTGTDNFDGDDIDTKYYAKGIIVGGSYKLAFPAKSGTLATLEDLAELGFKYSSFTLTTSIAAELIVENKLKKFGKLVVASFSFVGGSGTNYPSFNQAAIRDMMSGLKVPEGFRPPNSYYVQIYTNGQRTGGIVVNKDGTCAIITYPSDTGSCYQIGVTNTAWEVA